MIEALRTPLESGMITRTQRGARTLPGPLPADPGRQSMSMRPGGDTGRPLPRADGGAAVRREDFRTIRDRIDINQAFLPLRRLI